MSARARRMLTCARLAAESERLLERSKALEAQNEELQMGLKRLQIQLQQQQQLRAQQAAAGSQL